MLTLGGNKGHTLAFIEGKLRGVALQHVEFHRSVPSVCVRHRTCVPGTPPHAGGSRCICDLPGVEDRAVRRATAREAEPADDRPSGRVDCEHRRRSTGAV